MKGRVSISVNGRKFGLGCEDGEEERLMRLGQKLDDRVNDMANQFGQIGDLRLLVMDVNVGVEDKVDARIGDVRKESKAALQDAKKSESMAIESLMDAAKKIEGIAEKISKVSQ